MIGMDGFGRPFFFVRRLAMSPGAPKYADAPDSRTPKRFRTRGHPPTPSSALRYVDAPNLQGHPSTNSPKSPGAPKCADISGLSNRTDVPGSQARGRLHAQQCFQRVDELQPTGVRMSSDVQLM